MFKKKTLISSLICGLALILLAIPCMISFYSSKNIDTPIIQTRTTSVELSQQNLNCESIFNEFDKGELKVEDSLTTFVGYQTINLADLEELDNLSESNLEEASFEVKYNFSYDSETNIVTLSATTEYDDGETEEDVIYGVAFINEKGEIDAVLDMDGDYILLSELQDAGLIENCGWFKKAFKKIAKAVKKVCNTAVGVVGAVATIAVPAVIGVVGAIVAAPAVAVIAVGAVVGAGIAAGTAAASTAIQDGKVDWETVGICAGVGAVVGAASSYAAYKITAAIKSAFPKANPSTEVKSFDTYKDFKKEYGKASDYIPDGEWHHIVEQQTVTKGINAGSSVYNSQNTVAISKNLHHKVSGYYSRIYSDGMTFRQYVNTLPYEQQYTKGLEILKMFADQLGETIIWL